MRRRGDDEERDEGARAARGGEEVPWRRGGNEERGQRGGDQEGDERGRPSTRGRPGDGKAARTRMRRGGATRRDDKGTNETIRGLRRGV